MIDWNLVSSILEELQNLQKIKRLKLDDDEKICWMLEQTWELAQKAEREACAKLCDEAKAARLAEQIRARGQA